MRWTLPRFRTTGPAPTVAAALTLAVASLAVTGAAPAAAQDAEDRAAKAAVVRERATWLLKDDLSAGAADRSFVYGNRDDSLHVFGDWDGDGVRTPGVIRVGEDRDDDGNEDLVWHLRNDNSAGSADLVVSFGESRNLEDFDVPVVGDWDGDGVETVGVVRPDHDRERFLWLLRNVNESGNADVSFEYGNPKAFGRFDPREPRGVPVVGDWDGDGTTNPGVVDHDPRAETARWLLRNDNSAGGADVKFSYGARGEFITGDWDGDGTTNPGVHRREEARWLLRNSNTGGPADTTFVYGTAQDKPLVWR